jgi:uncharacterized membrane protein YczE
VRLRHDIVRCTVLIVGLALYGFSMALMVRAGVGLDPWDVLHQGFSRWCGISIGTAAAIVGVVVLVGWIPLRNKPAIGAVANVAIIAVTVDASLALVPSPGSLAVRIPMLLSGVALNGVATVLYVGAGLGPGPRDGLTTGLATRTGWSVRSVRTLIEGGVLVVGWLLGGTVGVGTVVYAAGIGPILQLLLWATPDKLLARSGWAATVSARHRRVSSVQL